MKLKLALVSTLLVLGATTTQATPSILSSVSSESIQSMTFPDASKARGEYWTCYHPNNGSESCHYQVTRSPLPFTVEHRYGYTTNSYMGGINYFNGPIYLAR